MKIIYSLLVVLVISCSARAKENTYIGSTPAHPEVREFLGIPLTDSIDFIRWKLVMNSGRYELDCQYGIGKPNTNGFIDEKKIAFTGALTKEGNYYNIQHEKKNFSILEINSNLIHL